MPSQTCVSCLTLGPIKLTVKITYHTDRAKTWVPAPHQQECMVTSYDNLACSDVTCSAKAELCYKKSVCGGIIFMVQYLVYLSMDSLSCLLLYMLRHKDPHFRDLVSKKFSNLTPEVALNSLLLPQA